MSADPGPLEDFVEVYEALIDWPRRLEYESPFYQRLFELVGVERVLDVACGTGHHANLFYSWGLTVEGADIHPGMIRHCRQQFGERARLHWVVRSFDKSGTSSGAFDVVLCVGNSLALAGDRRTVQSAVLNVIDALRPGGACVIQVLNIEQLPDGPTIWQKCRRARISDREVILLKGVHRAGDRGYLDVLVLDSKAEDPISRTYTPAFMGLDAAQLQVMVRQAGGVQVQVFGDYNLSPFEPTCSPDLILVARREEADRVSDVPNPNNPST